MEVITRALSLRHSRVNLSVPVSLVEIATLDSLQVIERIHGINQSRNKSRVNTQRTGINDVYCWDIREGMGAERERDVAGASLTSRPIGRGR